MSTDIFSRQVPSFGGVFAADRTLIRFPFPGAEQNASGLLTQRLTFSYNNNVTRVYDLHSNSLYLVVGRTAGTASLERVVGPTALQSAFYQRYGNACNVAGNNIQISGQIGCDEQNQQATRFTYTLRFCVITSISASIQAMDMLINEAVQLMVNSVEYGQ